MDTELRVKVSRMGNVPIVHLSGDIDAYTCGKLRDALVGLLDDGDSNVVINMAKVNYIDSSGLGTLVGGLRRVSEKQGGLVLSSASPQIRKVFTITGLSKVFTLYDDDAEAVRTLEN